MGGKKDLLLFKYWLKPTVSIWFGGKKIFIIIYLCTADVENCGSLKNFGFIYIYIYRLNANPCMHGIVG